jgi:DNA (cytosine-5)-methyltransferase 1
MMRVCDLFCGIGAFRMGFEQALGRHAVQTVYANDIDRLACKWYERYHGHAPDCCDVRQVQQLPEHDVLCAGFPCTAWSRAGLQGGPSDERGRLFDEVVRLIQKSPPRLAVLLENVPRVLAHGDGSMHMHIHLPITCSALGFTVCWRVLNAAEYGLAQQRKRLFYVGLRPAAVARFKWPAPTEEPRVLADVLVPAEQGNFIKRPDITVTRDAAAAGVVQRLPRLVQVGHIGRNGQGQRMYHRCGRAPTLCCNQPIRVCGRTVSAYVSWCRASLQD